MLDILIYAEPVKKVFAQGAFAAVSNIITAVVVGGLLILAYTKTIAKSGSLQFKQDMGEYWLDHNLADKVMFGSDSPRIRPVRSKRGLDSVEMLPETREKIYWKNAMRFFGWEGQNK